MTRYTHKKREAIVRAKAGAEEREGNLTPEAAEELAMIRVELGAIGRRSAAQTRQLGQLLSRAKDILPDKAFAAWVKSTCGFTLRSARNYIAVFRQLDFYHERIEAAAIPPTVLFVMAGAKDKDIENVLAAFENGEKPTVAKVRQMIGCVPPKKAEGGPTVGGLAGLRQAADVKLKTDIARFNELTTRVLARVEKALEPLAKGRAVRKGALQEAVMYDCRHAHDLFNSIAAPLRPATVESVNWLPAKLPQETPWARVQTLLHRMGGVEDWPGREEFPGWLQDEVIPLLRFVVHGESLEKEDDGEESEQATAEDVSQPEEELVPYRDMPESVAAMVDRALKVARPEKRERLRKAVFLDRKPAKRRAA